MTEISHTTTQHRVLILPWLMTYDWDILPTTEHRVHILPWLMTEISKKQHNIGYSFYPDLWLRYLTNTHLPRLKLRYFTNNTTQVTHFTQTYDWDISPTTQHRVFILPKTNDWDISPTTQHMVLILPRLMTEILHTTTRHRVLLLPWLMTEISHKQHNTGYSFYPDFRLRCLTNNTTHGTHFTQTYDWDILLTTEHRVHILPWLVTEISHQQLNTWYSFYPDLWMRYLNNNTIHGTHFPRLMTEISHQHSFTQTYDWYVSPTTHHMVLILPRLQTEMSHQ
jgi:hypothetical protein